MNYNQTVKTFGTAPVFFTAIATILGAILFLRFGFAVGQVGFLGVVMIILIGHAVTIPTAMAIAEIATNQKVEGGGEYYILSRSFGLVIGSTIGIGLYFSQAISVAFYIMAFSEAFVPLFNWLNSELSLPEWIIFLFEKKQFIGIPTLLILAYIMLTKGAKLGVKLLYSVVLILAISLTAFFLGQTDYEKSHGFELNNTVQNSSIVNLQSDVDSTAIEIIGQPENITANQNREGELKQGSDRSIPAGIGFFIVFAIIFPAFTGMTAGVGLSGDLKNPGKSIPLGTLGATLFGMIMYVFIAWKLTSSASPEVLADTSQLVMADIAIQGFWIIPMGLAAATISSALGSIMVAPRTLQAIARDKIFPTPKINLWLSRGRGREDEPYNATVITIIVSAVFILAGAIDSVAQIISMFFMVTYGSLCLISFLNHFSADPSYRPRFRSRWYISLFGAISCLILMFLMSPFYAIISLVLITALFWFVRNYNKDKNNLSLIFQGVIYQLSRQTQVFLQKTNKEISQSWRPSTIAISEDSFRRISAFDLLRWISHKYGFGTYIHFIKGFLSRETFDKATEAKVRLIDMANVSGSNVYVDTLVSPSFTSIVAQAIQLPGISGSENNLLLFEFHKNHPEHLKDIIDNFGLIQSVNFDLILLGSSEKGFGLKKQVHVWITPHDLQNANLMILLAYILLGHKEWEKATIKIFAIFPEASVDKERARLFDLINGGQLPISPQNIEFITKQIETDPKVIINKKSLNADLTIVGFRDKAVKHRGSDEFQGYDKIGNILYVHASESKEIK